MWLITILNAFTYTSSQQINKLDIAISILQMKKEMHREVKKLAYSHTEVESIFEHRQFCSDHIHV